MKQETEEKGAAMTSKLTATRLRELLRYDPSTGVFTWLVRRGNVKAGAVAGAVDSEGYWEIGVDGVTHRAARLAVLYMTGSWPTGVVDHKDGCRSRNVWENLRDVDDFTNQQNRKTAKRTSATGVLGVSIDPRTRKWRAEIQHEGKNRWLGCFDTSEEAHAKYVEAKRRLHAGCTI